MISIFSSLSANKKQTRQKDASAQMQNVKKIK